MRDRRLFICISGLSRIQRMLKKILHIQIPGKQKCMNAADSCFHNSGNFRKQRRTSITVSASGAAEAAQDRASFTESVSATAEACSERAGGESSRGWENKSLIMCPWCLDILTPAD